MKAQQSILLLTLLSMISLLIACGSSKSNTPASPVVSIAVLSGSGQNTSAGTAFTAHLLAFVTTGGSPTSGVTVTFAAPTSGAGGTFAGGANTATATTDNRGVAASPVFTANMTTGTYAVTAAVSGTSTDASFNLTNTASAISVSLNPAPPSPMQPGATTTLTAVVTNDASNSGVTWSCTPLNSCGLFNPATSTGSNATTTYTAPTAIPTGGSVTITATSVQNASASASAIVTIAAAPISVSFNPVPPSSLETGATATLTAVVANDPTNSGVTWSCAPLSACGLFNPTTSTGSNATTTYTAPTAIPTGGSVTITATSVQNASAFASAIVTITAPAAISVALNPAPPTSLKPGATTTLTAVVANDPTNSGVIWSCTPLNACGLFNPSTSTGSNATTTYTAPTAIPTGGSVTITATAAKSASASASANITISASAAIFVTLNPAPPTSLKPGATATLTAVVTNDTTNSGVIWSCTPLNACGLFNPTTSTGGTATTTYTAPTTIPTGGSVTVTATAVKSASASASANITITSSTAILADGIYVFRLTGQNEVAGAFQVKNGAITGGEQDLTTLSPVGMFSDLINGTGSSISSTADGNLQITLTTCNGQNCSSTDTNVGVSGVETLHGTAVSTSRALITEFDTSVTSSGSLDLQVSPVTAPARGYAFFTSGYTHLFARLGIGGIINVDGAESNGTIPISGTGSVFDINDGFTITQNQSFAPSGVTTPDTFGRVTFTLNPSAASGISQIKLVGYIVDAGHIELVETADTLLGLTSGEALGQGSNTGKFSSASIAGSSFVFGATGGSTAGQFQVAGVLTANLGGSVNGTLNCNDLTGTTCPQSPTAFTGGAYTVDATGRATLMSLTTNGVTLQLYLSGSGTGTVVSMDLTDMVSGLAYQQTAGASFSGTYGMSATGFDSGQAEFDDVGPVTAASGSITATHTIDQNYGAPPATPLVQSPGLSVSGTFTSFASGVLTGAITGLEVPQSSNTLTFAYYIVDTTRVIAIETDTNQWTLMNLELKH